MFGAVGKEEEGRGRGRVLVLQFRWFLDGFATHWIHTIAYEKHFEFALCDILCPG